MTKGKKRMWIITGIVILTVFAAGIYIFLGKNVKEYKKTEEVFGNPSHKYTRTLLKADQGDEHGMEWVEP